MDLFEATGPEVVVSPRARQQLRPANGTLRMQLLEDECLEALQAEIARFGEYRAQDGFGRHELRARPKRQYRVLPRQLVQDESARAPR